MEPPYEKSAARHYPMLVELAEQGCSLQQIADALHLSTRQVQRHAKAFDVKIVDWHPRSRLTMPTEDETARIILLGHEGMPSTWIAEDYPHLSVNTVIEVLQAAHTTEARSEWNRVWPDIFRHHLAHHTQFAPPSRSTLLAAA